MLTTYHIPIGKGVEPRRGDLLQSAIGTKRERTWFILHARRLSPKFSKEMGCETERWKLWCERWWEIEPDLRMRLFRSAQRHGQLVHRFYRFPSKKKSPRMEW